MTYAPEPDTRYQMLYAGRWRPVISMYDGKDETTNVSHATAAILYIADPLLRAGEHQAVRVIQGDIHRRDHRAPHPRDWDVI